MQSLTVVIPTHGRRALLRRTLDSLTSCKLPESYRELVVIENGSREGGEQIVKDLPERLSARYMHEDWGNKSHALNVALKTVEEGLVVFFDDDIRIDADALMAYAERAEDYDRGAFFGGSVEVDYENPPPEWLKPSLPLSEKGHTVSEEGEEFYLGFNWAAFVQDIKELRGFDPRFGPGSNTGATGQEADMQDRLLEAGCTSVGVPKAKVAHYVPEERANLRRVLERKYKLGLHRGTKEGFSKLRILRSIAAFAYYTLKNLVVGDMRNVCSGLANVSHQSGLLRAGIRGKDLETRTPPHGKTK